MEDHFVFHQEVSLGHHPCVVAGKTLDRRDERYRHVLARGAADVAHEGELHLPGEVYTAAADRSERLFFIGHTRALLLLLGLQVIVKLGDVVGVVFQLFSDLGRKLRLSSLLKFDIFLPHPLSEVCAREDFRGRSVLQQCGYLDYQF